jgi:2-polyprenyl-6-methoxyphenol hydroxylase-like FAD-dependent oxidoreductase
MIEQSHPRRIETRCAIAGGGPAGLMLGLLLARAGVEVVVLEKHGDFLRDFRGDTVHPSTLEVMNELGLLDDLLALPHQEVRVLRGEVGDERLTVADFSHLRTRCRFIAFMPQWELLNFLAAQAGRYPTFRLITEAAVGELVVDDGRIAGVRAITPQGAIEVRADLVVAADGRTSAVRALAGLESEDLGAPMDVLWMRIARRPEDDGDTLGRVGAGHLFVRIDRGDYWQCAMIIPKGGFVPIKAEGIEAFRRRLAALAPELGDRVNEIRTWDDVKLLTVRVDRLRRWYRPGLLAIGDAAHAMSPIGGVGINLAVQDAVAAANILAEPLRAGAPSVAALRAVQRRRELPTRLTQRAQLFIQNRVIGRVLGNRAAPSPPRALRLLARWPALQRLPARLIGVGVRPEDVRTRAIRAG